MRLFISVNLSGTCKEALSQLQDELYNRGVRGNFTSEENMHLTLAFIGEYPAAEPVMDALETVSFRPLTISIDGIGAFGDLWWAGISGAPALTAVARRVRHALADAGIPFDKKRFSPHITLLRRASAEKIPPVPIPESSMRVDTISLMRSDRGKRGMIYTELGTIQADTVGN